MQHQNPEAWLKEWEDELAENPVERNKRILQLAMERHAKDSEQTFQNQLKLQQAYEEQEKRMQAQERQQREQIAQERQQRYQKALMGILICNSLFIAANVISPSEENSYQNQWSVSTLLHLSLYAFNKVFLKLETEDCVVVPGLSSELIAAGLQQQGAPFWTGPVLTTSIAALALSKDKVSTMISNFWHKKTPSHTNTIKENEVKKTIAPHQ